MWYMKATVKNNIIVDTSYNHIIAYCWNRRGNIYNRSFDTGIYHVFGHCLTYSHQGPGIDIQCPEIKHLSFIRIP